MERRIIYDSLKELGALCSYLMPSPRSAHPYRSRLKEDRELDDESSSAAEQLQGEPFLKELQLWLNNPLSPVGWSSCFPPSAGA